jgi:hypothetical protein
MNKEARAVVLGLFVVVIFAFWRRPAAEFRRIRNFRVEVQEKDGDSTRRLSFNIPANLVARIAKLAPVESIGGNMKADWGNGEVGAREILDAAKESEPGKPGMIKKDGNTIEVTRDGEALVIDVKDEWDKRVHVRLPRVILEGLSDEHTISISEILRRLDELGPGDVVVIKDGNSEVTITAQPRKRALRVS